MNKKVLIIGGGLGGLAAGCYLRMNGYDTHILEKANQCGGIAVTWTRKGYTFDGATNYLPGSSPQLNAHFIIRELLDFSQLEFYNYPEFICIEQSGESFHVYTDADRLRAEMLRIAPEDVGPVDAFIAAVQQFGTFSLPFEKAPETFSLIDAISFLIKNRALIMFRAKWGGISVEKFSHKFKNERLQQMFQQIFPHHKHFAVMAPMAPLGWMHHKVAGYPMGGSAKIIGLLEKRYKSLGGTIEFYKEAKTVNIENHRARSVVCADGSRYGADIVVTTTDPYATINTLFNGAFLTNKFRRKFEQYRPFSALVQISLGIARTFEHEPEKLNTPLPSPLKLGTETATDMMVRILNFDPSYAPPGKTSVIVQLRTHDYSYWEKLRSSNKSDYEKEKQRVAEAIIDALEKRFGNIRNCVEVVDVATPATYLRYCNLYKGAHQGWAPTPGVIGQPQPKMLKGLKDFYMAGQWCSPAGGIPAVIAIARQVTQIICKKDKKKFSAME